MNEAEARAEYVAAALAAGWDVVEGSCVGVSNGGVSGGALVLGWGDKKRKFRAGDAGVPNAQCCERR